MSGETPRVQPFFCPYCGEQDLRPSASSGWHCRTCDRRFELTFVALGEETGSSSEAVAPIGASRREAAIGRKDE